MIFFFKYLLDFPANKSEIFRQIVSGADTEIFRGGGQKYFLEGLGQKIFGWSRRTGHTINNGSSA